MSDKKERMQSKVLPFDIFYSPNGQKENWLRTGKFIPEIRPNSEECTLGLDFNKAFDFKAYFEADAKILKLLYGMSVEDCLCLLKTNPQEYNQRLRKAKKNYNFGAMYGGGLTEVPESLVISQLKKREDNPNISLGSLEGSGFLKDADSDR